MAKLFAELVSANLIKDWAGTLDWLFDDNRFDKDKGWNRGKVGAFTKKVKKQLGCGKNNYEYKLAKDVNFPKRSRRKKTVVHCRGDSEGRDLVRHIRNGIAHGKTEVRRNNDDLYIEIYDYNRSNQQTAYIFIPVNDILVIHQCYAEIEQSMVTKSQHGKKKKAKRGKAK